jgi:hypothetical protein
MKDFLAFTGVLEGGNLLPRITPKNNEIFCMQQK